MSEGLGIKASENTVDSVLSRNYRYLVPDYQRRYSWRKKQWEALWKDLSNLEGDQTHFMGAIVVVQQSGGLDDINTLEVVDGQQRLTTVSLLLAALRDWYSQKGLDDRASTVNDGYLWVRELDTERYQNIQLTEFDNHFYRSVLDERTDGRENNQVYSAYDFFEKKLDDLTEEEAVLLQRRLLRSITLVTIECNSDHSAFRLFETLNNRGLELSPVDLMKNHLFNMAANSDDVDYEYVKDQWLTIVKTIIPTVGKPTRFFRQYLMSTSLLNLREPVTEYRLYTVFRSVLHRKLPEHGISIEDFVQDMAKKARLYAKIVSSEIDLFDTGANKAVNRQLDNLHMIKIGQAGALLLSIFSHLDNPNKIVEALKLIETFLIRRRIADYPMGTEVGEIYALICSEAFDREDPVKYIQQRLFEECPTDPEFRAGIENKSLSRNSRILFMLQKIESNHYDGERIIDEDNCEIEHIAPLASFTAKKYSTWPEHLNVTEDMFRQYRDRLGNLTLLRRRDNSKSGTHPFEEKKRIYADSEFMMTQEIAGYYDEWTTQEIQSRTKELAQSATQIWRIDRVSIGS